MAPLSFSVFERVQFTAGSGLYYKTIASVMVLGLNLLVSLLVWFSIQIVLYCFSKVECINASFGVERGVDNKTTGLKLTSLYSVSSLIYNVACIR